MTFEDETIEGGSESGKNKCPIPIGANESTEQVVVGASSGCCVSAAACRG